MNHQFWINHVKKVTKASFVAWEECKGTLKLKVVINGVTDYLELTGGIQDVTADTYLKLINSFGDES